MLVVLFYFRNMSSKLKHEARARLAIFERILSSLLQEMMDGLAEGVSHDRVTSIKYVLDRIMETALDWLGGMRNRVGYEEADEGRSRLEAILTGARRALVDSRNRPTERRLRAQKAKAKKAAELSARRALAEEAAEARRTRQARLEAKKESDRLRMAALDRSMTAREARVEARNRGVRPSPPPAPSPRRSERRRPRKQPHPKKLD